MAGITDRNHYVEASTYPIELVTCRLSDGQERVLFCKYLASGGFSDFGHRGGLVYEAKFYEEVLQAFPHSRVKYYGLGTIAECSEQVMVLEYLGAYLRFVKSAEPVLALQKAAGWAGAFHAYAQDRRPDFLHVYHRSYYEHWLHHFSDICTPLLPDYPFLAEVVSLYRDHIDLLLDGPQTIIHGEYYPRNVLLRNGEIFPVDWESAAIGPGEVDLATLIEDWDAESIRKAKEAYMLRRWPDGEFSRVDFERRLVVAKLYLFARFCPWKKVNRTDWIRSESIHKYLLQILGEARALLDHPEFKNKSCA